MGGGRGVSILGALMANGLLLTGLLLWGWSIWTAIAALWLENVVEIPFLAHRIRRALGVLPADVLATYLRRSDAELDVHAPGFPLERLRRILVGDPPATTAGAAARHFAFFWVPFFAMIGFFLAVFGGLAGAMTHRGVAFPDFLPFDGMALLGLGAAVAVGEVVTLGLDRRSVPVMPDTSPWERRFILVFLIVILGGWILGLLSAAGGAAGTASSLIAAAFVVVKTIGDLRSGYLPQRFGLTSTEVDAS